MELQEVINKRHSLRKYVKGEISEEHIRAMTDAANKAPSADNRQNWHFVIVRDRSIINKIAETVGEKNADICEKLRITEPEKAERFSKSCKVASLFFADAQLLVIVYGREWDPSSYEYVRAAGGDDVTLENLKYRTRQGVLGIGAAMENFNLKAEELGYGCCWMTSANYAADEIEAVVKGICGYEENNYHIAALMPVGIPAKETSGPRKKNIDEVLTII